MLTQLHIKNFTIVDDLNLELRSGMSVVTGETGAGKSIMIDALELALGARADSKAVRQGTERCEMSACFDVAKIPAASKWLIEHELNIDDECILRRTITADGRSRSYINGQASPLQLTKELGRLLVNIHGQHEHQSLLHRDTHRNMLDAYAKHDALLIAVKNIYNEWHTANHELQDLLAKTDNQSRQELLAYQVKELDELNLTENELSTLDKEHKQLANSETLLANCQQAINLSTDNDSSLVDTINQTIHLLDAYQEIPSLKSATELLSTAAINIEEASNEVKEYLDNVELSPERLQQVEQRLQAIYDIARKHHVKANALVTLHQDLASELAQLAGSEERIKTLRLQIEKLEQEYKTAADKLSQSRQKTAGRLEKLVIQSMQQLGMPGGKFQIQFATLNQFTAHGSDKIEFTVSANPGQALQALSKVASGGELSRISLAIQVITAQSNATPTLIFDEVDVGIGGGTAQIVGQLLRKLGAAAQVLCVTHLPQVASQGHQHLQVSKQTAADHTHTKVHLLSKDEKVQEIARMLGGVKITEQTLAHAEEMLLVE